MATKLIPVKCPNCGADLQIEEGRRIAYCTYCGAKVIVDNENEHIYRHIDEAEIKRAEVDEKVKMREMDLEENESKNVNNYVKIWIGAIIVTGLLGTIGLMNDSYLSILILFTFPLIGLGLVWFDDYKKNNMVRAYKAAGKVMFSEEMNNYEGKDYHSIERILKSAGFTNIQENNLGDLIFGKITKPGKIESITIDGKRPEVDHWYYHDVKVMINYHDFPQK